MTYGSMDINTGGGKFLRIESGKPVDIHVLTKSDDVSTKYVHYNGKTYDECGGKVCVPCKDGIKKEQRFLINVWDRDEKCVKVFEFGPNIAIGIREIARVLEMDGNDIHSIDLRISRVSEKPVRYQVVQRASREPIPEDIELFDLGEGVPF